MSESEQFIRRRQAFEYWFSDGGKYPRAVERNGGNYLLAAAQAAWSAWQAGAEAEACAKAPHKDTQPQGYPARHELPHP